MIRKTIPPAAVPVHPGAIFQGLSGMMGSGVGDRIEKEFREAFDGREMFLLSSGKAALCLLLEALKDLKDRRKVIIPGYTCFSVPAAVRKAGLEIVLCDVESESLDFDFARLEELADEETLCIVSTHLFGIRSDIGRALKIARRSGIFLVEDSAQAFRLPGGHGSEERGDAEFFSLGRGKNISCGSGGILLTGPGEIADAVRRHYAGLETESVSAGIRALAELALMGLFLHPSMYRIPDSLPFLGIGETVYSEDYHIHIMHNIKRCMMGGWKENLLAANEKRMENGEEYKDRLGADRECPIYGSPLPYLRFPVFLKDAVAKDRAIREFRHLGISGMYPSSIDGIREISGEVKGGPCPNSARVARTMITLPTHHMVGRDLIGRIYSAIGNDLDRGAGRRVHG